MPKKTKSKKWRTIPTHLSHESFMQFIFPHLPEQPKYGPPPKLSDYKTFNYLLRLLHTGCQWAMIPIEKDSFGEQEVHYTTIYRRFRFWVEHGLFDLIFEESVLNLHESGLLDISIIHGDGTSTVAKKGGDNLGYNGHKHMKGDKVVAFCDRNCNVVAPFIAAPGNRNECALLPASIGSLKKICVKIGLDLTSSIMSLDGVYDSHVNRKMIFNHGMTPNIPENKRNRKKSKRGRKRIFSKETFQERFRTIERVFAWEDKFKRLLMRFERLSHLHYALKNLAYTMINLRHFC